MLTGTEAGGVPQGMGFRQPRSILFPQPLELARMNADEIVRHRTNTDQPARETDVVLRKGGNGGKPWVSLCSFAGPRLRRQAAERKRGAAVSF